MAGDRSEYAVQLLRCWLLSAECDCGPVYWHAGWIRLCGLFFQRQSSRAGTDRRIYPHALETRKLRRAAGSHPVLLPHAQSLVRRAGRAQERTYQHGLSRFSLSAALTGSPFEVMRHMMAEKVCMLKGVVPA